MEIKLEGLEECVIFGMTLTQWQELAELSLKLDREDSNVLYRTQLTMEEGRMQGYFASDTPVEIDLISCTEGWTSMNTWARAETYAGNILVVIFKPVLEEWILGLNDEGFAEEFDEDEMVYQGLSFLRELHEAYIKFKKGE